MGGKIDFEDACGATSSGLLQGDFFSWSDEE